MVQLSDLLNSLPIHPKRVNAEKYRNPNGVYMKLCNFLRFDPNYTGKGLQAGGKLEKIIWDEFYSDQEKLRKIASAITENVGIVPGLTPSFNDDEEFDERRLLTKLHKIRERSPSIAKKKKASVIKKPENLCVKSAGSISRLFMVTSVRGLQNATTRNLLQNSKRGK